MTKILSQEEIDSLLTSVSAGEPSDLALENIKRSKVSLYDFKRPNLVSKEQMRLLENIHDGLARNFGVYLSAQLRMIVDINLLAIDQIMYSEFVMSIVSPGAIYVGSFNENPSQYVLEFSPQLAIFIVERLFGGSGKLVPPTRSISVIEQRIMARVVERISHEISKNWAPIKKFDSTIDRFESNPEFVQIVSASEPVIVVSMEATIHNNTTMLNICYPYRWISDVLSSPDIQEKVLFGILEGTEEEKKNINTLMERTPIDLRALLGRGNISIDGFLKLDKGDTIVLDASIKDNIPVYAENQILYEAGIGLVNENNAVSIQKIITGDDSYEYGG